MEFLTDDEIGDIARHKCKIDFNDMQEEETALGFARAVEAAVLAKLGDEAAAYARGHRHGHDEAMNKFSAEPIGYAENEELDAQREYPHNVRHMAIWYDRQDATTPLYTRTPPQEGKK